VERLQKRPGASQRRICKVIVQSRSTQRLEPKVKDDEEALLSEIINLASQYGRYGYRRITALLRRDDWGVNHKRVERIWRQEGLKVSQKQSKRGRLWLTDGSCVRLRPTHRNHVWSYDFVADRTHDGRALKILTVIDEYERDSLAILTRRRIRSDDVLHCLADLFLIRGIPDYIRSDNGPEFTARQVRNWLQRVGMKTLFIEPGSPWETGYIESFNGKLRDELLNREYSTPSGRPRCSSRTGGWSTTPSGPTCPWAISRLRRKPSCPRSARISSRTFLTSKPKRV
jgi:putative transposase